MNLRALLSASIIAAALSASAATLVSGGGRLCYSDSVAGAGQVTIEFAPCMANELFTFSRVDLNGKTVNATSSDNIGPFGVAGGWSGGNHLNDGRRSAETLSVSVAAFPGARIVDPGVADTLSCDYMVVEVRNRLVLPDGISPFADETIRYTVAGNSIDVAASHTFLNEAPVLVDRYYGMQSMFAGETEILTPGGPYVPWTPIAAVDRFPKADQRGFCLFVEHSPAGYQACWLDPAPGTLGDRALVDDSDWVFIGNSYTKAYHKTIGGKTLRKGDTTRWHGIYSWFDRPLADTPARFAYQAFLAGVPVVMNFRL